jgi:hypothetical protein
MVFVHDEREPVGQGINDERDVKWRALCRELRCKGGEREYRKTMMEPHDKPSA